IQAGEIRVVTSLVIPTTVEDEIALVLKMPRQHASKAPGQEHADLLRERYGDRTLPLLAQLLDHRPDFVEAADAMLYLDADVAAAAIFRAVKRTPKYAWDFALDWYLRKIAKDPDDRFRGDLHLAAARIIEASPTDTAVDALVLTGSDADVPL